jgi:hypothetical protein
MKMTRGYLYLALGELGVAWSEGFSFRGFFIILWICFGIEIGIKKNMEKQGIDPCASRMLNERSTT